MDLLKFFPVLIPCSNIRLQNCFFVRRFVKMGTVCKDSGVQLWWLNDCPHNILLWLINLHHWVLSELFPCIVLIFYHSEYFRSVLVQKIFYLECSWYHNFCLWHDCQTNNLNCGINSKLWLTHLRKLLLPLLVLAWSWTMLTILLLSSLRWLCFVFQWHSGWYRAGGGSCSGTKNQPFGWRNIASGESQNWTYTVLYFSSKNRCKFEWIDNFVWIPSKIPKSVSNLVKDKQFFKHGGALILLIG